MKLEEIKEGCSIKGFSADGYVTVEKVTWTSKNILKLIYRDIQGNLNEEIIYRDREEDLEIVDVGQPWSFTGDAEMFRLVSEAYRISLAYIFDPLLAVHTSLVEPYPHQITAVYEKMLPKQPLKYLLADDPGAGKTIMTGLLIKELIIRGDVERCMIVCPGNLVEQWQDELMRRFHLHFNIMTNDEVKNAPTGNWFSEKSFIICRLDMLSRNENYQEILRNSYWDMVVCDEAHKMSATFDGGSINKTKRYKLGELLSTITKNFLLLTATPHNGKDEDFQLFLSLLDSDRFEGRFRDGVHQVEVQDMMRRMVKEDLVRFDGKPLFPERKAYTVEYNLSELETELYERVTEYVRQEFNRADKLNNPGRRGTIGFALTILQRRLASSPEAIYNSLERRRKRLEKKCEEEKAKKTGLSSEVDWDEDLNKFSKEDIDDFDDSPAEEIEILENQIVDLATASRTIEELEAEISTLKELELLAMRVRQSNCDKKWAELSELLKINSEMYHASGDRRKLIIFSEHRDTIKYLIKKITPLVDNPEAIVEIHGSMSQADRKKAQLSFTDDKNVHILVATDAAGEGINLQKAHLMVNYDLPWNPNRLEQRFGRIHRIGQKEICHCWNLVALKTREGDVYRRLLEKIDRESTALGGKVFDVLGKIMFGDKSLQKLLIEAIRAGDSPEIKERYNRIIDESFNQSKLSSLLEVHSLAHDSLDMSKIETIKDDMERIEARKLQPYLVSSFFYKAINILGGKIVSKGKNQYEIPHVPSVIRRKGKEINGREIIRTNYKRITFDKDDVTLSNNPDVEFISPGHPLLDATINQLLDKNRHLLKEGALFVDETDSREQTHTIVYLENTIKDARKDRNNQQFIVSKEVQFISINNNYSDRISFAGYAPYLDFRPLTEEEQDLIERNGVLRMNFEDFISKARQFATEKQIPKHLQRVKSHRISSLDKVEKAVKSRLIVEINHWENRVEQLKYQEKYGNTSSNINYIVAKQRLDELTTRLNKRLEEITQQRRLSAVPPLVVGAAIIIPIGLINRLKGVDTIDDNSRTKDTSGVEMIAMRSVMKIEKDLGFIPLDVSQEKCGYDIESRHPDSKKPMRFIEVKGRRIGADIVTITKNELLTALNKPNQYILAIVEVDGDNISTHYIDSPFSEDFGFGVSSVNYKVSELASKWRNPYE